MTRPTATPAPCTRILVAGLGNVFLKDDGFGAAVAARLQERPLRKGVSVFDFGTGGLNLAYEMMRGYDGLVLVDASQRGGEPGTLYVIEPESDSIEAGIGDGDELDPHAMDPESVLRFVKSLAGWPGRVLIVACEPADVDDLGIGLSEAVQFSVDGAVELVEAAIDDLATAASA